MVAASPGLLHGAVELSRFGVRAAIIGGCDLRQRFVVSPKGCEGARRPAPSPDGTGPARHRSCYDKHADTHSALEVVARRTRGTDVLELKRVAACYDCQSSLPIEASMRVIWMLRRRQLRNSSTSIPRYWHRGVGVLLLFYYEKRRDARALPTHPIPAAPRFKTKI